MSNEDDMSKKQKQEYMNLVRNTLTAGMDGVAAHRVMIQNIYIQFWLIAQKMCGQWHEQHVDLARALNEACALTLECSKHMKKATESSDVIWPAQETWIRFVDGEGDAL